MSIRQVLHNLLRQRGYDVVHFSPRQHPLALRKKLLNSYNVNVILDVGADVGQWAKTMRQELGFSGRIVSFEPLRSTFSLLQKNAARDSRWQVLNYALGDKETVTRINIAQNSHSSSFLDILPRHIEAAPQSQYVGTETVEIRTLDSIFDSLRSPGDNVYLKIDTQGYEGRVIKGAEKCLTHIATIQIEMSLVGLYQDQMLFDDMYCLMCGKGYELVSIETGFSDPVSGRILQVDGIFHRF